MDKSIITILSIVFIVIVFGFLFMALRKIEKKNRIETVEEALLNWEDIKCPKCLTIMEQGYTFAGKGIIWTPKQAKLPGTFATTFQALENTFSLSITPAVNMAWRCDSCKMIVIDYSRMLKRKKKR